MEIYTKSAEKDNKFRRKDTKSVRRTLEMWDWEANCKYKNRGYVYTKGTSQI